MRDDKLVQAKCRQLLEGYEDVIDMLLAEVVHEAAGNDIQGTTAFEYAKAVIRRQGIKEGTKLFKQRLTKHAAKTN